MGRSPIIGIATSFDEDTAEPLLEGKRLLLLDVRYVQAVEAAGAAAVILPPRHDEPGQLLDYLDGLLVPGNERPLPKRMLRRNRLPPLREQSPRRYESDAVWLRGALDRAMPILAVCRGMQTLNEVLGGTLWNRLPDGVGGSSHVQREAPEASTHPLLVEPDSLLASILGVTEARVNSFHRQGIRTPGEGLRVCGRSAENVVEAIEYPARPFVIGVQFHPERLTEGNPAMTRLFAGFVAACDQFRHPSQLRLG